MAARSQKPGGVSSRVPNGPVEVAPPGFVPRVEQQLILDEVLAGVELGAWDQRMVAWLAGWVCRSQHVTYSIVYLRHGW
jgi:hypothetical protein